MTKNQREYKKLLKADLAILTDTITMLTKHCDHRQHIIYSRLSRKQ